jgi:hypothetical protein
VTVLGRLVARLGEYSDDAHNAGGGSPLPGRVVNSVSPSSVVVGTGTTVSVSGAGFGPTTEVYLDGVAKSTTHVSGSTLRFNHTAAAAGSGTVTVEGATGQATLTYTLVRADDG